MKLGEVRPRCGLAVLVLLVTAFTAGRLRAQAGHSRGDATKKDPEPTSFPPYSLPPEVESSLDKLRRCLQAVATSHATDLWNRVPKAVNDCAQPFFQQHKTYRNKDEGKYALEPAVNGSCLLVTLGIGGDVVAELKLKERFPHCRFVGADPTPLNGDVYRTSLRGEYAPVAVAAESGVVRASLRYQSSKGGGFAYHMADTTALEFLDFLRQKVGPGPLVIDHLWMDNEGPEWSLLPKYLKKGVLDGAGYRVCQWNVELHGDKGQQRAFPQLLDALLKDSDFLPVRMERVWKHLRTFWLDLASPECRRKFPACGKGWC